MQQQLPTVQSQGTYVCPEPSEMIKKACASGRIPRREGNIGAPNPPRGKEAQKNSASARYQKFDQLVRHSEYPGGQRPQRGHKKQLLVGEKWREILSS